MNLDLRESRAGFRTPGHLTVWLAGIAVILGAWAARLAGLDLQSLWYDEGTSVALASRGLAQIAADASRDIHPPLYYWLLAIWTRLAGDSVFVVRYVSAACGLITVAGVMAIGARLSTRAAARLAGLLAATSPFLLWYSQEARSYALAAALGVGLVLLAVVDGRRRPTGRDASASAPVTILVFVGTLAALYTHYVAGPAAILAANVALVLAVWSRPAPSERRVQRSKHRGAERREASKIRKSTVPAAESRSDWRRLSERGSDWRRLFVPWVGAQALAGLLFVPWLLRAWPAISSWPAISEAAGAGAILWRTLERFAFGSGLEREAEALPLGLENLGVPAPGIVADSLTVFAGLIALAGAVGFARAGAVGFARAGAGRLGGASSPGASAGRKGPAAGAIAVAFALAAPILVWTVSLTRPAWNAKLIVPSAAGFELLLAFGVLNLASVMSRRRADQRAWATRVTSGAAASVPSRRHHGVSTSPNGTSVVGLITLLALLLVPRGVALASTRADPALQRDNYRGVVGRITAEAGPNDAVLLVAPTQIEVFDYYARSALPTYPLPGSRPMDANRTLDALREIGDRHGDLFLVRWAAEEADPEGLIWSHLARERHLAYEDWYGNVRLSRWAPPLATNASAEVPVAATFDGGFRLESVTLPDTLVADAFDAAAGSEPAEAVGGAPGEAVGSGPGLQPGQVLRLEAHWRRLRETSVNAVVFTQLLDKNGELIATRDRPPVAGERPTSSLETDVSTVDRIGLVVPADLRPGTYALVLGLYDPATGQRLAVTDLGAGFAGLTGDVRDNAVVILGDLKVLPSP